MNNDHLKALGKWAAAAVLTLIPLRLASGQNQSLTPYRQTPNPYNIVAKDLDERDRLREARDRMRQVLDLAGVRPGMTVGEAGSGDGYFTLMLAERVGPTGKIFANDINRESLQSLEERARKKNLSNIETIQGTEDDPRFPDATLDMIFIIHAFHEFPEGILLKMKPSLKPDGKINIVEYGLVTAVNEKGFDPNHQKFLDNFAKNGLVTEKIAHVDLDASEDFCPVLYILSRKKETAAPHSHEGNQKAFYVASEAFRTEKDLDLRDRTRAEILRHESIFHMVKIEPGMTVGDIGAGDGYFTFLLNAKVGPSGKVYAEDIEDQGALDVIRERARIKGLGNIETILGAADDPKFPKNSLDAAFIMIAFHEFDLPVEFLSRLAPSLKPGAKLVIIEGDNAVDRPEVHARDRKYFLSVFEKSAFKVEKIDDITLPLDGGIKPIVFVLSLKD